jgi:hypothetical protein
VCLSLLDAGARSRRSGRRQFSKIVTLDDAIACVTLQLEILRTWGRLRGISFYDYDEVAFDMDKTIERMATELQLSVDRDAVKHHLASSFTHKNKAKRNRYKDEMTPEQNEKCLEAFGSFIEEVILGRNHAWFAARDPSERRAA